MRYQETAKMYKGDEDYNDISMILLPRIPLIQTKVTLPAYRFGLAAKVTKIIMIFQCFLSAHTVYLNNGNNNYNVFIVFFPTEELARACKSL